MALYFFKTKGDHDWGDDFALYINQAKSLVNGNVQDVIIKNTFSIENSSLKYFSPVLAPWGWPILISMVYAIFGPNIYVLKCLIITIFFLFIYSLNSLLKEKLNYIYRNSLLLLITLNIYYIYSTNAVLTEIPFLFFSTLCLCLIGKYSWEKSSILYSILLGFLMTFTFFIRTEGIMLFLSIIASQIVAISRSNSSVGFKNALKISIPYCSALITYISISKFLPSGFLSHIHTFDLFSLSTIWKSLIWYYDGYILLFGFQKDMPLKNLLYLLFFVGIIKRFIPDIHIAIFTLGLLGIHAIWPYYELRYLYLSFPFVAYFMIQGLSTTLNAFPGQKQEYGYYFLGCIILCISFPFVTYFLNLDKKTLQDGPYTAESKDLFDYINKNTNPNDRVIFFRPRALTLYTGRYSAMIYKNPKEILEKGDFLVIDKTKSEYFQIDPRDNFIENQLQAKSLKYIYSNNHFIIYKIYKYEKKSMRNSPRI